MDPSHLTFGVVVFMRLGVGSDLAETISEGGKACLAKALSHCGLLCLHLPFVNGVQVSDGNIGFEAGLR